MQEPLNRCLDSCLKHPIYLGYKEVMENDS